MLFTSRGIYLLAVKICWFIIKRWHFRFIFCFCYIVSIRGHKLQKEKKTERIKTNVNSIFLYSLLLLQSNKIIGMGGTCSLAESFGQDCAQKGCCKNCASKPGLRNKYWLLLLGILQLKMMLRACSSPTCMTPTGAGGTLSVAIPPDGLRWLQESKMGIR